MKTIKILAEEFGVCTRTFHRLLRKGDPQATAVLSAELVWRDHVRLEGARDELRWLSEAFEKANPDLAAAATALATKIEEAIATAKKISERPAIDWEDEMARLNYQLLHTDWDTLINAKPTPSQA